MSTVPNDKVVLEGKVRKITRYFTAEVLMMKSSASMQSCRVSTLKISEYLFFPKCDKNNYQILALFVVVIRNSNHFHRIN